MTNSNPHNYSSYARILISDWKVLAELVNNHTAFIKKTAQGKAPTTSLEDPPEILDQRQLEDAVNGPYSAFFKTAFSAYARLSRVKMELNLRENEVFKDGRAEISPDLKLPSKLIEGLNFAKLDEIANLLNDITREHNDQWLQALSAWCNTLIITLQKNLQFSI